MRRAVALRGLASLLALAGLIAGGIWWHRSSRPIEQLNRGRAAIQAGDWLTAEQYAESLEARQAPDHARLLRAELAFARNDPALALRLAHPIPRDGEWGVDAAFLSAKCLMALRRPREAEAALAFVVQHQPDHAEAHRWAGVLYYDQGDFPRAVDHLRRTSELLPDDAAALRLAALIHHDLENHREAVPLYRESLRRNAHPRGEESVRTELAISLLKLLQPAEAMEALGETAGPDADTVRAEALIALGHEDRATSILDAGLTSNPDHGGLLWLRARQHRAAGNNPSSIELLSRLLKRDPHDSRARHLMAQACEALGRSDEAADHLARAKETETLMEELQQKNLEAAANRWDPGIRLQLAELCDRLGKPEMAAMWRRAAEACRPVGGRR